MHPKLIRISGRISIQEVYRFKEQLSFWVFALVVIYWKVQVHFYLNFRPEYMSSQSNVLGVSLRRNLQPSLVHFLPCWNKKEITFPSSQRILLIVHCFLQAY